MSDNPKSTIRSQWRSETSYLLVTIGAIVGLGNFFEFPFLVAEYGGIFVLFYILCEIGISIPLLFSELMIGRRGKQNPVGSIGVLSIEVSASYRWRLLGWLSFVVVSLSLASYCCAAAYPVGFFYSSVSALFAGATSSAIPVNSHLVSSFSHLEMFFLFFLFATALVVIRGINRGLELISQIVVPSYFLILLGLAIYTFIFVDFTHTLAALFDFKANGQIVATLFAALTFAFFKLGVGMGSMIVYGSYLPYSVPFARSTLLIILFDAIISLLSYFIIYPLTIRSDLNVFSADPIGHNIVAVFATTPGGLYVPILFFFAAIIAAWTPTIAMAETAVITLIERLNLSRLRAVLYLAIPIILIGTFDVLTQTRWDNITLFNLIPLNSVTSTITAKILTFISAFFIAIFAGWVLPRRITKSELGFKPVFYKLWLFLVRFIAPISIVLITLATLIHLT